MGNVFKIVLLSIGCIIVGSIVFFNVIGSKLQKEMRLTKELISSSADFCPEGTIDEVAHWGKAGYSRYCIRGGAKDGRWVAWEKKRIVIEGFYKEGNEFGKWTWYNPDGSIHKIIMY